MVLHARTSRRAVSHRHIAADESACGTPAGFRRHRHHGEQACTDCYAAAAAYLRMWRLRRNGPQHRIDAADEAAAVYSRVSRERSRSAASPAQIRELVEAVTDIGPADAVNVVYAQVA